MKEKTKSKIVLDLESKISHILVENGFKLVDIEIKSFGKKSLITIFVYGSSGIDHNALQDISNKLYPFIENVFFNDFILEVSSPGLYRKFKYKEEFNIFSGRNVKLVNSNGTVFTGVLLGISDDIITLQNTDDKIEKFHISEIQNATLNG